MGSIPRMSFLRTGLYYLFSLLFFLPLQAKIYDCFLFFNEVELLELRLEELYDEVDHFVLVESCETFRGNYKPLYFTLNKQKFSPYLDKIIHVLLLETTSYPNPWDRETYQRNQIMQGLTDCSNDDIILISDIDEFINPHKIPLILESALKHPHAVISLAQTLYRYYLNLHDPNEHPWYGTIFCNYGTLKNITPQLARNEREELPYLEDMGWHFTFMGGYERVIKKLEAYSHAELDTPHHKHPDTIQAHIDTCIPVEIDETFPESIQRHQDRFSSWILPLEN